MDKQELRANQVSADDKELKGLQNKGVVELECADCGEKLLCLQLAGVSGDVKAQVLTRVAVKCGICEGFSYVKQVPGTFYPGAPSDQMAFDVADDTIGAPEADVLFKAWRK
ncbi:MAG: hypothetical protein DRJ03_00195 [Chloroflexi bacterium]|nr:MAG: hypothetical protein DRJ03_00195 [Chloroflexota bacterium]